MRIKPVILPAEGWHASRWHELLIRGGVCAPDGKVSFSDGESISLDTYYNSFPYTKYLKWTTVAEITFSCRIQGRALMSLMTFSGEKVCEAEIDGSGSVSADLRLLPADSILYVSLKALSDTVVFLGGEYSAPVTAGDISCCVGICTYKREKYLMKNIQSLRGYDFTCLDGVLISDNGGTLDCDSLSDGFISAFPNRNYGGSGGFTRTLIEGTRRGFSHIILTDDDIEFFPEVFETMTVFLSLLREEHADSWISAAMMSQNVPYIQYEMGAFWDRRMIIHRITDEDMRSHEGILRCLDDEERPDYGAWWCLAMPLSVCDKQGLPIPFFIKFDDVEYGMRRSADTRIITMNGIAVTHEDFANKFSPHLVYYDIRNSFVTSALHGGNTKTLVRRVISCAGKQLLLYRYDSLKLVIRAVNDYLKGVDFFLSNDEEKLNRELMGAVQKPQQQEIPKVDESVFHGKGRRVSTAQILTLGGNIVPAFLMKKEPLYIPSSAELVQDCYRRRTLIEYCGTSAYVRRRSFRKSLAGGFSVLVLLIKLLLKGGRVSESYRRRYAELTSFDFWEKHLGI